MRVVGFGKDEALWISQYDSWSVRGGFRSEYTLVGRGGVTSDYCGKHRCYYKCGAVELHDGVFMGKDIWHNVVMNCHRPCCSRCWKYGWAVREANSINSRFLTAESVLGLRYLDVEHLSASVPKRDYGLSYEVLSRNAILALKASGVIGGCIILHGHRKDYARRDLFWSPHFHCLGYIEGGYDRCRNCVKVGHCWDCDGFEGRTRRAHVNDGWIVSLAKNEKGVVEKRENVFGTAWYQLEHASLKVGVKRFQIVKWFGVVGNRKLKTVVRPVEHKCVVCHSPMELGYPYGAEPIVSNRGERGFLKDFMIDHVEDEGGY
ncbi:MAG: hypothetical protein ABSF24_10775 [Candidatus Bathyarchaeia archaeon]